MVSAKKHGLWCGHVMAVPSRSIRSHRNARLFRACFSVLVGLVFSLSFCPVFFTVLRGLCSLRAIDEQEVRILPCLSN